MKKLEPQIALLVNAQIDFIIVGGLAAVLHGADYFTHDIDVCYSRAPENLEKLAQALQSVKARLRGASAEFLGPTVKILSLSYLVAAKQAAGRPKDLLVLPQLEAILEAQKSKP